MAESYSVDELTAMLGLSDGAGTCAGVLHHHLRNRTLVLNMAAAVRKRVPASNAGSVRQSLAKGVFVRALLQALAAHSLDKACVEALLAALNALFDATLIADWCHSFLEPLPADQAAGSNGADPLQLLLEVVCEMPQAHGELALPLLCYVVYGNKRTAAANLAACGAIPKLVRTCPKMLQSAAAQSCYSFLLLSLAETGYTAQLLQNRAAELVVSVLKQHYATTVVATNCCTFLGLLAQHNPEATAAARAIDGSAVVVAAGAVQCVNELLQRCLLQSPAEIKNAVPLCRFLSLFTAERPDHIQYVTVCQQLLIDIASDKFNNTELLRHALLVLGNFSCQDSLRDSLRVKSNLIDSAFAALRNNGDDSPVAIACVWVLAVHAFSDSKLRRSLAAAPTAALLARASNKNDKNSAILTQWQRTVCAEALRLCNSPAEENLASCLPPLPRVPSGPPREPESPPTVSDWVARVHEATPQRLEALVEKEKEWEEKETKLAFLQSKNNELQVGLSQRDEQLLHARESLEAALKQHADQKNRFSCLMRDRDSAVLLVEEVSSRSKLLLDEQSLRNQCIERFHKAFVALTSTALGALPDSPVSELDAVCHQVGELQTKVLALMDLLKSVGAAEELEYMLLKNRPAISPEEIQQQRDLAEQLRTQLQGAVERAEHAETQLMELHQRCATMETTSQALQSVTGELYQMQLALLVQGEAAERWRMELEDVQAQRIAENSKWRSEEGKYRAREAIFQRRDDAAIEREKITQQGLQEMEQELRKRDEKLKKVETELLVQQQQVLVAVAERESACKVHEQLVQRREVDVAALAGQLKPLQEELAQQILMYNKRIEKVAARELAVSQREWQVTHIFNETARTAGVRLKNSKGKSRKKQAYLANPQERYGLRIGSVFQQHHHVLETAFAALSPEKRVEEVLRLERESIEWHMETQARLQRAQEVSLFIAENLLEAESVSRASLILLEDVEVLALRMQFAPVTYTDLQVEANEPAWVVIGDEAPPLGGDLSHAAQAYGRASDPGWLETAETATSQVLRREDLRTLAQRRNHSSTGHQQARSQHRHTLSLNLSRGQGDTSTQSSSVVLTPRFIQMMQAHRKPFVV
eukprot:TRINITY_DN4482_c0_g1_i2.p1 TRINITY_DN4482_c0_g1~~TRINITY_DN4482_c0_g1_i2.p1  ORF type:complete len:1106 (-),score=237.97 TRINITY_DN4482_c0_g1_i2:15-3332(-)